MAVFIVLTGCTTSEVEVTPAPAATAGPSVGTTQTTLGTTSTSRPKAELFLLLDWPPPRVVVTSRDLIVRGSATPESTIEAGGSSTRVEAGGYTLDGHSASYFELPISLEAGDNNLTVIAVGSSGAVTSSDVRVTYLPDATEELAFLTRVSASEIVADYAQWLTGEEADQAAVEAGDIPEGEQVPNGYYILNVNDRLRTLPLVDPPVVVLPTSSSGPVSEVNVSLDEWLGLFDAGKPWAEGRSPRDDYFGAGSVWAPYWLTIQDGVVAQIHQQYVP